MSVVNPQDITNPANQAEIARRLSKEAKKGQLDSDTRDTSEVPENTAVAESNSIDEDKKQK